MKRFFVRVSLFITALLLRFRYKITFTGLDDVKKLLEGKNSGCLFLPNHPAVVVDPLIVSLPLVRYFHIRPLIVEYMYYHPAFHWAVRMLNALAIPNFGSTFNALKLKRAERALKTISEGLKNGDRFLIYPAGTTKFQAREVVGGAFGVHQLVAENPDVPIVLVRMTGLWGSSFSRATTCGETPNAKEIVKKNLWTLVKNLFFFIPKRHVLVEFEIAPPDFPRSSEKQEFNRYLEAWYNKPFGIEGEPLSLVSYAFWKKELLDIKQAPVEKIDLSSIPDEVKKQIIEKVASLAKVPANQVLPDLKLIEHLGLDSLDHAELISFLEEQFNVAGIAPQNLTTVGRLFLIASGAYATEERVDRRWSMKGWNKKRPHELLELAGGNTVPEVFMRSCEKNLFQIACSDPIVGPMTYYKCKRAVLLLSKRLKTLEGDNVGILLPASNIAYLLVIACHMAGKVPVMINWTVGGKHLDTVVSVSELKAVISSWAFLDALENTDISSIEPLLHMLEELKADISLLDIMKESMRAFTKVSVRSCDPESTAVILFTSGTEGMPKGVPLTHNNILFDLRSSLKKVLLYRDDTLLAMLPPFHSFGFSVTGLLPLLSGFKVVYYPNPTDSKRLAKAIERWKTTVLCSAPTFLKNILQFAKSCNTSSLRLLISGAEKAPEDLFKLCQKALFVEGYGITECSPVITANISGDRKQGVGKALEGVKIKIVDPEHLDKERQVNETGLILVSGPNVFSGYLNKGIHDPFIDIDGLRWYETGDLGMLDSDQNLILSGRLKRFIKIGGEMISLTAVEEALSSQLESPLEQFALMTDGDLLGKVQLVLFTTHKLETQEVNQILRKGGCSNLVKIDRVVTLKQIPQTATGKIAYRELDKQLKTK